MLHVLLKGFVGVVEDLLAGVLLKSKDCHQSGHHSRPSSAQLPLDPLVTSSAFVGVGAIEGGVSIGEVSGNSNRLVDAAIVSLEHGVLASHVLS